jgi:hypothetical protein
MSNASGEVFKPLTGTSLSHCNRHQQRHTPHNKLPEFGDVHQHKCAYALLLLVNVSIAISSLYPACPKNIVFCEQGSTKPLFSDAVVRTNRRELDVCFDSRLSWPYHGE